MTMQLFIEAKSYATQATATKKLEKELKKFNLTTSDVRWLLVVTAEGRIVPVVQTAGRNELVQLAHLGIGVM